MDCANIRQLLDAFVLGATTAEQREAIITHLRACRRCRQAEARRRGLVGMIRREAAPRPPRPAFVASLHFAVRGEIASARRRMTARRTCLAAAAVAAAVLMAAGLWSLLSPPALAPLPDGRQVAPTTAALADLWQAGAGMAFAGDDVVVHGSAMYAVLKEGPGLVAAVDARTGDLRWKSSVQSIGRLAADDVAVYCLALRDGAVELLALNASDGQALWRYAPGDSRGAGGARRPVIVGGRQLCWTDGNTIRLLDRTNGRALWARQIDAEGALSDPVADGGHVLAAGASALHALDLGTGEVAWRVALDGTPGSPVHPLLATAGRKAFVAARRAVGVCRLACIDLGPRTIAWSRTAPAANHMTACEQGLYLRGQDVLAFDPASGKLAWTRKAVGCGPVTWADGMVYFVDSRKSGSLVALRPDGDRAWQVSGLRSCDAFNKVGDRGYIRTQDGVIHAIRLADWRS